MELVELTKEIVMALVEDKDSVEVKEFDTEFPAFSEGGFPDSDSDVFDKLLKEETKACGEAGSEK